MRKLLALTLLLLTPTLRAQNVLFQEDFESGLAKWSAQTWWQLEDVNSPCSSLATPFPSGTKCAWFGNPATCTIGSPSGAWNDSFLDQNAPVLLPADGTTLRLSLRTKSEGENNAWDRRTVWMLVADTGHWVQLADLHSSDWQSFVYDLTPWAGHTVRLRLEFWTGDDNFNDGFGWFVDDIAITSSTDPATPFCTGDGDSGACPCANQGAPGRGCASSIHPQGALLAASGTPSLSNDSLVLTASDVSPALVTFFAGQTQAAPAQLHTFGDGMNCISGPLMRARALPDASGTARIPLVGNLPLSQQFNVTSIGSTRYVQALYRSAGPFCTTSTFNLTNGLIVTWRP